MLWDCPHFSFWAAWHRNFYKDRISSRTREIFFRKHSHSRAQGGNHTGHVYSDFKSRDQRAHRINLCFVFLFLACEDDLPNRECLSLKQHCNDPDLTGRYMFKYCSKTCDGKFENQLRPYLSLLNKLLSHLSETPSQRKNSQIYDPTRVTT